MEEPGTPQRELVASLRLGHEADWERLVRESTGRLLAVAKRILRNEPDAEEAVQEAFLAAYRSLGQFDGRAALSTWLHRITVNAALAILGRRKRDLAMDEGPAGRSVLGARREAVYEPAAQAELARAVWGVIAELPEEQRVVLVLRDVEELSSQEVATALGITDAAVRQRLHRARQAIAERLRPELREGPRVTCGGRLELLFDAIDGSLLEGVREPVLAHLASCVTCQTLRAGYEWTIRAPRTQLDAPGPEWTQRTISRALAALRSPRAVD